MATMTLDLTEKEMAVLTEMSTRKDLTKRQVMRQALRLYQMIDIKIENGERLFYGDEHKMCGLDIIE